MTRRVQVEQLLDDGSHPAIPQSLFTSADYAAAPARAYGCPCCSRLGATPGLCDVCTTAGWSAPALDLGGNE